VSRFRWAPAAAAAYLLLAAISALVLRFPHRPVFDGQAPALPYRWVEPPADLRESNRQPLDGSDRIPMDVAGSEATAVQTEDAQAQATFAMSAFPPGEDRAVEVSIRPLAPASLASPPRGLRFDGNAYELEASYVPSGRPAKPVIPATLVLRYARHATVVLRWTGATWERVQTDRIPASLTVFSSVTELGTFVPAGPPPRPRPFPWATLALLSGGAAVLAVVLGLRARRRIAAGASRSSRFSPGRPS
jgi:hypothetical protein